MILTFREVEYTIRKAFLEEVAHELGKERIVLKNECVLKNE